MGPAWRWDSKKGWLEGRGEVCDCPGRVAAKQYKEQNSRMSLKLRIGGGVFSGIEFQDNSGNFQC
jgi:hypothetical protein